MPEENSPSPAPQAEEKAEGPGFLQTAECTQAPGQREPLREAEPSSPFEPAPPFLATGTPETPVGPEELPAGREPEPIPVREPISGGKCETPRPARVREERPEPEIRKKEKEGLSHPDRKSLQKIRDNAVRIREHYLQALVNLKDQEREMQNMAHRIRGMVSSMAMGYQMSLQRVDRALEKQGLEVIEAVGQPFDPEAMEVLEAVGESGYPAGTVLEEVRRGYRWQGRIFRFAQVRVARG